MRSIITTAIFFLMLVPCISAQNMLKESFDYPVRDSIDGMGGWLNATSAQPKVAVVSPGLSFADYAGSGVGNAVRFKSSGNGGLQTMNLRKVDTGSVYLSYLMRVDSLPGTVTAGYTVTMDQFGGPTKISLRAYIQRMTDSTFKLGVSKYQGLIYSNRTFKTKQTLLVVLRYQFVAGANNDSAKINVFDQSVLSVPKNEPAKPDTFTTGGADVADIGEIWLSNSFIDTGLKGASVTVDEIRVGQTWSTTVLEPMTAMLTEDFYFAKGDTLRGKNGWDVYYGGTPLFIDSLGLSYTGYNGSGMGRAMRITGGSGSQSLYRNFLSVEDTNIYLSSMVNVTGTNATQGFFLSLTNIGSGNYRAMIYSKIENNNVYFGLRTTLAGSLVFDTTKYQTGKTYVLVLKYTFVPGADNDVISLFVLGSGIPVTEPTRPNIGPIMMLNDAITPGGVALNSGAFTAGGPLQGATILVDGIRVTKQQWRSGLTSVRPGSAGTTPSEFTLEQNYPNPFNPATVIKYRVSANSVVTLKVFDALGREAATLVNELKGPGAYTVPFDGSRLSSGVYYARLQSGNSVQIKKMMLLK